MSEEAESAEAAEWDRRMTEAKEKSKTAKLEEQALWRELAANSPLRVELGVPEWMTEDSLSSEPKTLNDLFPITVAQIVTADKDELVGGRTAQIGMAVSVRLASAPDTLDGIYLGDLPTTIGLSYAPDRQVLVSRLRNNPAMWVPSLGRVVWGFESWWGPKRVDPITDAVIAKTVEGYHEKAARVVSVSGTDES